ncbi:ABC-type sugar transport system ATPase subunit [Arthrobacter sp. UYP6]|uniref:sugar ABC transporter ATP-binding protein n=1 Tax=Arthrobacter sp. UYP6 TaxID=1756378 RepID=UPI003396EA16
MADSSTTITAPRLELRGISKRFGGVQALTNADFSVRPGSVHALIGENGAGKSTLIRIISGAEVPDAGVIMFDGEPVTAGSTVGALNLGIETVYQEPQLFDELTVVENVYIGRELTQGIRIDWRKATDEVADLLDVIGLPQKYIRVPVGELSIAEKQQVSIAKALARDASVLILDEPSAILSDAEIDRLFAVIRALVAKGVSVIYISHRLDELSRIADEITVMRDGRTIETRPAGELSVRRMAELMVGGVLTGDRMERKPPDPEPFLELDRLSAGSRFRDISFSIRRGEIVGLYGLVGSGAGDVASALYGILAPSGGSMTLGGRRVDPRSPAHAQRLGIALLPANRKAQGMFSFQSIAFNISVGHLRFFSRAHFLVNRRSETRTARDLIRQLSIRTPDEKTPISAMSGGNAQKVVLARQLVGRPRLLVLVEPTQGVDIGAKEEIHRIIAELADQRSAVLVATSDLTEVMGLCDSILVVRAGTITAKFGPETTQVDVLTAAAGESQDPTPDGRTP